MKQLLVILSFLPLLVGAEVLMEYADKCTTIGAGKAATVDGSTFTTHNDDCRECDFRITKVPARDWPAGSLRPIMEIRNNYPIYMESPELNIHGPDHLFSEADQTVFNFTQPVPYFYIPQVPHTYGYILGTYGIQNEKQLSIGESTCGAVFYATPLTAPSGKAALHMPVLTELAMERCATARCAVQLIGSLSEKYGFYGPDSDVSVDKAKSEAGEALIISDTKETWVFHILPDDTGASAVWVAQRVPDDHITAVANQFVITEIDFKDDGNTFLYSSNIVSAAVRTHLWSNTTISGAPNAFNFLKVYGMNIKGAGYQCTRRVWRVFTLAAPSLLPIFSPYSDSFGTFGFGADGKSPYPFSVRPDQPLTVSDVMAMNRDQYEGTAFDMTKGLDAGAFGDPVRYVPVSADQDPLLGLTVSQQSGAITYNRAISVARTSYSVISLSRGHLPDVLGAVAYLSSYAPHHSVFLPIYTSARDTPSTLRNSSLYKFDDRSAFWVHSLTGNYLSRWYRHTIGEVVSLQQRLETSMFTQQAQVEAQALRLLNSSTDTAPRKVSKLLGEFHESNSRFVLAESWSFFYRMVAVYRDNVHVVTSRVDNIMDGITIMTVARSWLESIGYWGAPFTPPRGIAADPVYPINVPSERTPDDYAQKYPLGMQAPYTFYSPFSAAPPSTTKQSVSASDSVHSNEQSISTGVFAMSVLLAAALGAVVGACAMRVADQKRYGTLSYLPIK